MKYEKHSVYKTLGLAVAAVAVFVAVQYIAPYIPLQKPGPTQAEWQQSIGSPEHKTLFGKLLSNKQGSVVLFAQEAGLGTTTVAITASTTVVRDTPLSPDAMKAAQEQYKKLEAESGGKPFQGPETMKVEPIQLADLSAGDLILVTLTVDSTKDHFVAERIELVPSDTTLPAAPASAGSAVPL